ncbi:hypothetical protein HDU76_006891, partial [Blyttiomyces sp. JEL0837]
YRLESFKGLKLSEVIAKLGFEFQRPPNWDLILPSQITTTEALIQHLDQHPFGPAATVNESEEEDETVSEEGEENDLNHEDGLVDGEGENEGDDDENSVSDDEGEVDNDGTDDLEVESDQSDDEDGAFTPNEIVCIGGWKTYSNYNGLFTMASVLCKALLHSGQYTSACNDCVRAQQQNPTQYGAKCMFCPTPNISPKGNPSTCPDFIHARSFIKNELTNVPVVRSEALNPRQYHDVVVEGMEKNPDPRTFMLLTMFNIASHMYFRSDDIRFVHFKDVEWHEAIVHEGRIVAIPLRIFAGKADAVPKRRFLRANTANPALCPINFLMLWMCLFVDHGDQQTLFPQINKNVSRANQVRFLSTPAKADENPLSSGCYDDGLMEIFTGVDSIEGEKRLTSHTPQRIAVYLAKVGGATAEVIRRDGRMGNEETQRLYEMENGTLGEIYAECGERFEGIVGEYKSIYGGEIIRPIDRALQYSRFLELVAGFKHLYPAAGNPNRIKEAWCQVQNVTKIADEFKHKFAYLTTLANVVVSNPLGLYDFENNPELVNLLGQLHHLGKAIMLYRRHINVPYIKSNLSTRGSSEERRGDDLDTSDLDNGSNEESDADVLNGNDMDVDCGSGGSSENAVESLADLNTRLTTAQDTHFGNRG